MRVKITVRALMILGLALAVMGTVHSMVLVFRHPVLGWEDWVIVVPMVFTSWAFCGTVLAAIIKSPLK